MTNSEKPKASFHQSGDLNQLSKLIQDFCTERDWDQFHAAKDIAIGMVTESAELLDLFRFKTPEQVETVLRDSATLEKVSDELADVFYWVLRFADKNQIDLAHALEAKMLKNAEKYPVEKTRGKNLKYDEY